MEPTLRMGSRDPAVKEFQDLLNKKVFPPPNLKLDGQFGPKTNHAWQSFLSKEWLAEEDGSVTKVTWNALKGRERYVIAANVQLVAQHTDQTCWSAATAMLKGVQACMSPGGAKLGAGGGVFNDSASKDFKNMEALAKAHGLRMNAPQSYMPAGLASLMRAHGKLMVNVLWDVAGYTSGAGSSGHMIIFSGIRGDDTADGTTIRIHDPWPPGVGKIYSVNYAKLMQRVPTATYMIFYQ